MPSSRTNAEGAVTVKIAECRAQRRPSSPPERWQQYLTVTAKRDRRQPFDSEGVKSGQAPVHGQFGEALSETRYVGGLELHDQCILPNAKQGNDFTHASLH